MAGRGTCLGLQIALDSQARRCFINIPYYYGALLITALGNNGSTQQLQSSDANQLSLRGATGHSQKSSYLGKHSICARAQAMCEALEDARLWGRFWLAALTQSGDVGAPSCPRSNPHPRVSDAPAVTLGIGPYPSSSPVVTATVSVGPRVVQNEAALGQP